MRKIIFDFKNLNSDDKLHDFLDKEFMFSDAKYNFKYGRNLHAFWDLYSYVQDDDFFELKNYHTIKDEKFKAYIDSFIEYLNDLKGIEQDGKKIIPNPNFDYKIIS